LWGNLLLTDIIAIRSKNRIHYVGILPAELGPGVHSTSDTNEYKNHKIIFLGSKALLVPSAGSIRTFCYLYLLKRVTNVL
jgi:hypothetical protein